MHIIALYEDAVISRERLHGKLNFGVFWDVTAITPVIPGQRPQGDHAAYAS